MTLHLASGEFCANFDDDDLYASTYVENMVGLLEKHTLEAVTFSGWFNFCEMRGNCGYSDSEGWQQEEEDTVEDNEYGYGFSYVHRRSIALILPYPNLDFAEDAPFMLGIRAVLGTSAVGLFPDTAGTCLHIVHAGSTTEDPVFSRDVPRDELLQLEVGKLRAFKRYIRYPDWSSWLKPYPMLEKLWYFFQYPACNGKHACT